MLKIRTGLSGLRLIALAALLASTLGGPGARADDMRPLLDRIDRLERDLNQVQRQVYRNQVGTAPTAAGGEGGASTLDTQIRMDQIEAQLRTLTGQLEEIQYNISRLSTRLDKAQADNEVRFQQLEGHGAAPPSGEAAAVTPPPQAPAFAARAAAAGEIERPAPATGTLALPPPQIAPPPPGAQVATAENLPSGTALEQYNEAFNLLRGLDYRGAELAFRNFLQKHPNDPLASNAQYWLGETFFVRNDFPAAVQSFAEGYQKYPQGPKAPDNLLKLGMALGNSGRKQEACFSFARLERDFPQMAPVIKEREVTEKKRIGC
jgi:tol-pal system protein YbgF